MSEVFVGADKSAGDSGSQPADKQADDKSAAGAVDKTKQDIAAADSDKKSEGAPEGDKKDDKPQGAPEKYEAFKFEDGVTVDDATLESAQPLFKEANLSQEQAQKFVDFYAQQVKAATDAQVKRWEDLQNTWREEAKKDKDFGGQKFEENVALAKKALDQFGSQELLEHCTLYGWGNNVHFLKFASKVGKAISDDSIHGGGKPSADQKTAGDALFADMFDKKS